MFIPLFYFAVDSPMVIDSSDDEDFECTKKTTPEIHDIDSGNDIFAVTEYAAEIYQYLKQAEVFLCVIFLQSNLEEVLTFTRCLNLFESARVDKLVCKK